ncbi:MAG TPA: hypothetical protein VGR89_09010, partial [Puia sp.]|nr:hypothetical protein [Puia sp.]
MRDASTPATVKKARPYRIYIKPSLLWSTVTSHECMESSTDFSVSAIETGGKVRPTSPVPSMPFI